MDAAYTVSMSIFSRGVIATQEYGIDKSDNSYKNKVNNN